MQVVQKSGGSERVEPPIEFNHLYVTLAAETVDAIAESDFIVDAFSLARQTIKTDGGSWTGTYLRGKQTYLEFFAPGGAADFRTGHAGIGFSTQRLGQLDQIEKGIAVLAVGRLHRRLRRRQTEQGEVSWFHDLRIVPLEKQHFTAWLMEFHEDYLQTENVKMTAAGLFDRGAYMAVRGVSDSLLDDISEVHLDLLSEEQVVLDQLLRALGFHVSRVGSTAVYHSAGFTLRISTLSAPVYRIRKVICSMTVPSSETKEYVFGHEARLAVHGASMVWSFGSGTDFGS